jgi:urease accessory protein
MKKDFLLWQLADSAFPSGGFAHSGGLEAVHQLGRVSDADSLEPFLENGLRQLQKGVACFAHQAWTNPHQFAMIDQDCDLFLNNHVANRGSCTQGRALLASASKAFASSAMDGSIAQCSLIARQERLPTHLAPTFGLISRGIGISATQMDNLFLFIHLRGYISAAIRLGIVGPMQAQRIQANVAEKTSNCQHHSGRSPTQINPMLDLMQMTQDRLYSRLFQS